jgi:hypothetical protein
LVPRVGAVVLVEARVEATVPVVTLIDPSVVQVRRVDFSRLIVLVILLTSFRTVSVAYPVPLVCAVVYIDPPVDSLVSIVSLVATHVGLIPGIDTVIPKVLVVPLAASIIAGETPPGESTISRVYSCDGYICWFF